MGESLLVRKAGGGGAKIEELIQEYTIASGNTISAGTFVDYVNGGDFNVKGTNVFVNNASFTSATTLDSSRVLVAYMNNGNSNYGTAVVLTISGTTISVGTPFVFQSSTTSDIFAITLDSSRVLVAYRNESSSQSGNVRVLNISGTTITAPNSNTVFQSSQAYVSSAITIDGSRALVLYYDGANANVTFHRPKALVVGAIGSQITLGSNVSIDDVRADIMSATMLDSSKALVVYSNYANGNIGTARVLSITGITITTPSSAFVFNSTNTSSKSVTTLDSSRVLVAYQNANPFYGYARVLNISGFAITAPGSAFLFNNTETNVTKALFLDSSKVLVSYRDGANNFGVARTLFISGNTISAPNNSFVFNDAASYQQSATMLDNLRVLFTYRDGANSNFGTARVFEGIKQITNTTAEKVFGLAKTGGTAGQTVEVFVNE
jgi:hypothetical protein